MPRNSKPEIAKYLERSERKISRLIDRIKAVGYEEFDYISPEVDKIISECNTDWLYVYYIFTSLMGIVVVVDRDEKVVEKARELLDYVISMDMEQAVGFVLEYNYVMSGFESVQQSE